MIRLTAATLLAATALTAPAFAQSQATTTTANETPAQGESPAAEAVAAPPTAEEAAAQAEFLTAQIEALQEQVEALKKVVAQNSPQWKGMPQFNGSGGWSFKPKGFMQFDAGTVENPNHAIATKNLGLNSRPRRIIMGAEGTMPGGFGYKAEIDFGGANGTVGFEDVVLTYAPAGKPLQLTIGNFYPLSSLETMTSSRVTSFMERAAFTDAFNYSRRLGVALAYVDPSDMFSLTGGVWTKPIDSNFTFGNDGWQASVRGTWSPQLGEAKLHLGANYQHREFSTDGLNTRYRARPMTQITDIRFVDTGALAAKGDDAIGLEAGAIFKSLHLAGEWQQVKLRSYRPGTVFSGLDTVAGAAFTNGNPKFGSWYAEAGYFLTGESRGYKGGKWDRTKVLHPFDQGGWGAWQIVGRYDVLDLTDRLSTTATPAAAANFAPPNRVSGGEQRAIQVGLNWQPIDYVRFMADYANIKVDGGPSVGVVNGVAAGLLAQGSDYDANVFTMRAQIEF